MHNMLEEIIAHKHKEVIALKNKGYGGAAFDLFSKEAGLIRKVTKESNNFKQAVSSGRLSIIGEIKRSSPSAGNLSLILDPLALLKEYLAGGVSAVSVLTDQRFFSGSIADLQAVSDHLNSLEGVRVPVLRKDFIVDKVQILESVVSGANAILLIVSVLKEKTKQLLDYAKSFGIDAIVEVHNKDELNFAIDIGAEIIGINNRDLNTFKVDINRCLELAPCIPKGILKIAESGIKSPADIKKINKAGFDAVLIGEALVRSEEPAALLSQMAGVLG